MKTSWRRRRQVDFKRECKCLSLPSLQAGRCCVGEAGSRLPTIEDGVAGRRDQDLTRTRVDCGCTPYTTLRYRYLMF